MRNREQKNWENENYRRRYAAHPSLRQKKRQRAATWIDNHHERWLLRQIKLRAKKTEIRFNLTVEDIVVPKRCPVFGIPLQRGKKHSCDNSPTVDRINPDKGYVKGNVAIISRLANSLKGKATAAQHRRIADWMDTRA
jgi:hypothetical protein